jgi:hypothetical protein
LPRYALSAWKRRGISTGFALAGEATGGFNQYVLAHQDGRNMLNLQKTPTEFMFVIMLDGLGGDVTF